ncbi:unnamed protein product [Coffea canephora]|uniref:Uncharacterized protein n=1 Tax=Coffea canephora TaxID=49390 RepID=A0A068U6U8_COFCA|nr:unnamed protein product [Coffea canephora]
MLLVILHKASWCITAVQYHCFLRTEEEERRGGGVVPASSSVTFESYKFFDCFGCLCA